MPANMEVRAAKVEQLRAVDEKKRRITVVISTFDLDSHGTRIDQSGWDFSVFKTNPVIPLAHDDRGYTGSNGLPVAKGLPDTIRTESQKTYLTIEFPPEGDFPLADTVFKLAKNGFINAVSVGFQPVEWEDLDEEDAETKEARKVRVFRKQLLLEVSIVTIPSNSNALVQRARKLDREGEVEQFRAMAREVEAAQEADPVRWNRSLSRAFDVAEAKLAPSNTEFDWISKHLGCEVKKVFQNSVFVPSPEIGSFLSALRNTTSEHELKDVRNIVWDRESPPVYEVIRLNSTQSDEFLIDGVSFYSAPGGPEFAVKVGPDWGGLRVMLFTTQEDKQFNRDLLDRTWAWAKENNFLKGEAFALSGEFIGKTADSWDGVFLAEKNEKALKRAVQQVNDKGEKMPNRGMILTGSPGNGKTLSGRVMRNETDATFIWVSSRDFWRCGAVGGLSYAFRLARDLAPSVLFLEDIDNWLRGDATDLLKTEMDGISRSTGVLTVLTTNFPEQLPQALIDRPGRFHDVLHFDMPDEGVRSAMLARWLDDLAEEDRADAVKKTAGYSGAHVYELAHFARTLQETEDVPLGEALRAALKKIEEQKDLITSLQLAGSKHRPMRLRGVRVERSSGTVGADMTNTPSPAVDPQDPEYVARCVSYFEQKKPANKASTRVLKQFFAARGEDPPADEVEAWKRMEEILEAEEAAEDEPVEKPAEAAPEAETPKEEPKPAEAPPAPAEEAPAAPEAAPTEQPTPPTPTPAETPRARQEAPAISLKALLVLRRTVASACVDAYVKASRKGLGEKEAMGVIDAVGDQFARVIANSHP